MVTKSVFFPISVNVLLHDHETMKPSGPYFYCVTMKFWFIDISMVISDVCKAWRYFGPFSPLQLIQNSKIVMNMISNISMIKSGNYPRHFANYPRHLRELPSHFWWITLVTTSTVMVWFALASISNCPRHLIYFPCGITRFYIHEFLRLCIHDISGIIADHMSYYG